MLDIIKISSIIIILTSDNFFLKTAWWQSFSRNILFPIFIWSTQWIFVPLICPAATPVGASNKILGFSESPTLYVNTLLSDIWIVFMRCDFLTTPPPVINIWKVFMVWGLFDPRFFIKSFDHLCNTSKTFHCSPSRDLRKVVFACKLHGHISVGFLFH